MATVGYIFLAKEKGLLIPFSEQQQTIESFARGRGIRVDEVFIENESELTIPFGDRKEGRRIVAGVQAGDSIVTMKAEWVLASAREAVVLLQKLRAAGVSLYCVDLDENISLDAERKLVVAEGGARLVQALLSSLAVCELNRPEQPLPREMDKREESKYLGGPVPFGWQVDDEGFLIQDEYQRSIITEIRKLREERISYRNISKRLGQEYDIKLSSEGIRKILKREQSVLEKR